MDASASDRLDLAEQQARDRLTDIQERLVHSNRQLYQHLALYLQVLREGLLPMVQQACFHLVSQGSAIPYAELPDSRRSEFQARIRHLVERCTCLLTVEQLVSLAAQRQRQEQRQRRRQRQELLASLQPDDPGPATSREPGQATPDLAPQSIHLGLELPLSADLFTRGVPGLVGLNPMGPALEEPEPDPGPSAQGSAADPASGFPAMEAFLALAAETLQGFAPPEAIDSTDLALPSGSLLPDDPQRLLHWWHQLDLALRHRLRNLSHAVNVVLVRDGLSQALLPIPLLEAVLGGQVEAMPAPANLLRVALPNPAQSERPAELLGVLIRQGDLEFELPRLRTCRQRLEQHRRRVRRMAQHHRHWQRRRQSIQAQLLWENDITAANSHRDPID